MFSFEAFYPFSCSASRWGLVFVISPSLSNCRSAGAFQSFALWALGFYLLAEASVSGAFQHLPGVSGLLMRIVLTSLYHWESQGSAVTLFSNWCPNRGNRAEPGNHTSTSKASRRTRPNGRSSLGIQPRDTSDASCGNGLLTPCTGSSVQVSREVVEGTRNALPLIRA